MKIKTLEILKLANHELAILCDAHPRKNRHLKVVCNQLFDVIYGAENPELVKNPDPVEVKK